MEEIKQYGKRAKRLQAAYVMLIALAFVFIFPLDGNAHVGYVLSEQGFEAKGGFDLAFLLNPLAHIRSLALIAVAAALAILAYFIIARNRVYKQTLARIDAKTEDYKPYFAWMLRLALGIALIGAGTSGVVIAPAVEGTTAVSFLQTLLGFLLLLGLALPLVVPATIALFLWALFGNVYLVGNMEFLAAAIALLVLADSRPGFDDLFSLRFYSPLTRYRKYVPLLLRIGIGSAMIFLAVYEKLLNPHVSAVVVEQYALTAVIPVDAALWVLGAGVIEFAIGAALLAGFKTRLASAIAFFVLSFSFFYFGEDVYSHITLFGVLSVLFVTGSGKWGVDKLCTNKSQPTNAKRGV